MPASTKAPGHDMCGKICREESRCRAWSAKGIHAGSLPTCGTVGTDECRFTQFSENTHCIVLMGSTVAADAM
jgi:hypothetical protein